MPRPRGRRRICGNPHANYFKPAGIKKCKLEVVVLEMDEFEAIRLKDFEKMDQKVAAKEMAISQTTFHRLLSSAREKIADAIVNGKAVEIAEH